MQSIRISRKLVEPAKSFPMNIYQSTTYKKDLCWLHFDNELTVLVNPRNLKGYFVSVADPSMFTSIVPVILDQSNKTSLDFSALKSTSPFLP